MKNNIKKIGKIMGKIIIRTTIDITIGYLCIIGICSLLFWGFPELLHNAAELYITDEPVARNIICNMMNDAFGLYLVFYIGYHSIYNIITDKRISNIL